MVSQIYQISTIWIHHVDVRYCPAPFRRKGDLPSVVRPIRLNVLSGVVCNVSQAFSHNYHFIDFKIAVPIRCEGNPLATGAKWGSYPPTHSR